MYTLKLFHKLLEAASSNLYQFVKCAQQHWVFEVSELLGWLDYLQLRYPRYPAHSGHMPAILGVPYMAILGEERKEGSTKPCLSLHAQAKDMGAS